MQTEKVIIFGLGDMAEVAHYFLTEESNFDVVAFTVDKEYVNRDTFKNLPVVPFEDVINYYPPTEYKMYVAIGYNKLNKIREEKYLKAKEMGYNFVTYIHPSATVAKNAKIGENCFILENNTIQPFVKIEDNCILWSGSVIAHHSVIKRNCFIAPNVTICGYCIIEENTFIGANATIRDHVKIGRGNIIGAGCVILENTKDFEVYSSRMSVKLDISSYEIRKI